MLFGVVGLVVEKVGAEVGRLLFTKEFGGTDGTLSKEASFNFSRY